MISILLIFNHHISSDLDIYELLPLLTFDAMFIINDFLDADSIFGFKPILILLASVILLIINWQFFKFLKSSKTDRNITKSFVVIIIILTTLVSIILTSGINEDYKEYILTFMGVIIAAGFALGSTTVLGNLVAGIMNKSMKRFRNGDLIKIGDMQGKVTKSNVFHVEIQLEDSNFMSIPNLYMASNPVKLTRDAKSVISTSVSLGYDISRTKIEGTLKEAALAAGLMKPYVFITNLGDYSATYKIHGFLEESDNFLSKNSKLNAMVMDSLHSKNIEIASPSFTNQREVNDMLFIPKQKPKINDISEDQTVEDEIFDKAKESGQIEALKDELNVHQEERKALKEQLEASLEPALEKKIKTNLKEIENKIKAIEKDIKTLDDHIEGN